MAVLDFDLQFIREFMRDFHGRPHAGAFVSGASQSGKTTSWLTCIEEDMRCERKGMVILPHGDQRLTNFAATLSPRIREKIIPVCPADGRYLPINPLFWKSDAEIPAISEQIRKITRYVYGDQPTETASPNIDHYIEMAIEIVIRLRLPITLAADAINPFSGSRYKSLRDSVLRLDDELITDFAELEAMDAKEWLAIVKPAHKRLNDVFRKNPFIRNLLSSTNSIDPRRLFDMYVIVDLKKNPTGSDRPLLRDKDRILLACLYAITTLNARMNHDAGSYKHDFTITYDELTIFRPLRISIETGLREAAKYGIKQVGIQQNDELDNPLLDAFRGNAAYFLNFLATSKGDQDAFAVLPHRMTFNPSRVKHVLKDKEQYHIANQIISLINKTNGWSDGNSGSTSSGDAGQVGKTLDEAVTATDGTTATDSHQVAHAANKSRHNNVQRVPFGIDRPSSGDAEGETDTSSRGRSSSSMHQDAFTRRQGTSSVDSWSHEQSNSWTNQYNGSITIGQSVMPVYGWRDVVRSIQFLTESEQLSIWYGIFSRLHVGQCVLTIAGVGPRIVQFPIPYESAKERPKYLQGRLTEFLTTEELIGIYPTKAEIESGYKTAIESIIQLKLNSPEQLNIVDAKPNRNVSI